ncbi:MAG: energy-coupling factor transporter ATPase [Lachnospiraceae bacterium]|nr:energy-coupling factor transporter ATPase [Lachnospiraceae bacterium]MBR6475248.1 energy-coupling factor transporter ATPase [Lachnospiraceae bacterium]
MVNFDKVTFEYIRRDEEGNVESINKALDEIDLNVKKGDFIAILGANGSGKSTLARHINALLTPTEGTVFISEMNTKEEENLLKIRQKTGMVFQNPDNQIIAGLVEEDVGFGPENIGVPTKEIWERVAFALEKVGMTAYREKSPNNLSGGQKQRVAIAGILAMKPECIVLDEPTAMLDPKGRREVIETITELNKKEGITIILITHYMNEVVGADKVYVMSEGNVKMAGTPREIFKEVELLKEYKLDVPQVTEIAYRLRQNGLNLPDCILTIDEFMQCIK